MLGRPNKNLSAFEWMLINKKSLKSLTDDELVLMLDTCRQVEFNYLNDELFRRVDELDKLNNQPLASKVEVA